MTNTLEIDGKIGGGQILRTTLSLSAILKKPIKIINIRAGRPNPGLQRQHLCCVMSIVKITNGTVVGAEIGSPEITFVPSAESGLYNPLIEQTIEIGSSGSCMLVLQCIIPVLIFSCNKISTFTIKGGTHESLSPSETFIEKTFFPALFSVGISAEIAMKSIGLAPSGIGEVCVTVNPINCSIVKRFSYVDKIAIKSVSTKILYSDAQNPKPKNGIILADLRAVLERAFIDISHDSIQNYSIEMIKYDSGFFGFSVVTEINTIDGRTMVITSSSHRNNVVEIVNHFKKSLAEYLAGGVYVDEHLSDQLMLPAVLANGATYVISSVSDHFVANLEVTQKFFGNVVKLSLHDGTEIPHESVGEYTNKQISVVVNIK